MMLVPTSTKAVEALKLDPLIVKVFAPAVTGFGVTEETTGADGAGSLTVSVTALDAAPPTPLRTRTLCDPAANVVLKTSCVAVLEAGVRTLVPTSTCAASVLKFVPVIVKVFDPAVAGFGVMLDTAGPLTVSVTVFEDGPPDPLRARTE